jgi:hypothetical protein
VCAELGQNGPLRAQEKERKACRPGSLRAELEEREREWEREREGFCFFFFFKFLSNSFFKHSNSNQTKSMHSNHDAQAIIISKLF